MLKQKNRRIPPLDKRNLIKVKMSETVVTAFVVPDTEDDEPQQEAVKELDLESPIVEEPVVVTPLLVPAKENKDDMDDTSVVIQEYDIRRDQETGETESMNLINCKSYMFAEDVQDDGYLNEDNIPSYVVEEFDDVQSKGSFLDTLKTLVNISANSNVEDLGSISSDSEGSGDDQKHLVSFDLMEPLRVASQSIIKTSTQFFADTHWLQQEETEVAEQEDATECNKEEKEKDLEKSNTMDADMKSWSLDKITKWL